MFGQEDERLREIEVERVDLHVRLAELATEEARLKQTRDALGRPSQPPRLVPNLGPVVDRPGVLTYVLGQDLSETLRAGGYLDAKQVTVARDEDLLGIEGIGLTELGNIRTATRRIRIKR